MIGAVGVRVRSFPSSSARRTWRLPTQLGKNETLMSCVTVRAASSTVNPPL